MQREILSPEKILENHFGSDFHEIKQPCYLDHIVAAMKEYANQENLKLISDLKSETKSHLGGHGYQDAVIDFVIKKEEELSLLQN